MQVGPKGQTWFLEETYVLDLICINNRNDAIQS